MLTASAVAAVAVGALKAQNLALHPKQTSGWAAARTAGCIKVPLQQALLALLSSFTIGNFTTLMCSTSMSIGKFASLSLDAIGEV